MSISNFAFQNGQPNTQRTILTTTANTTIVDAQQNRQNVVSITVSNVTAAACNLTLESFDGTTAYSLITLYPGPALGTLTSVYTYELPITLEPKWIIRAKAGVANALHVHASGIIVQAGRYSS